MAGIKVFMALINICLYKSKNITQVTLLKIMLSVCTEDYSNVSNGKIPRLST